MIYFDSSEGRLGTRLSEMIRGISRSIIGLEAQTGADLLISPLDAPLPENVNRPPGSLLLRKHTEAGMLIQRKSGGDMLNSIPKLSGILQRMQQWNSINWLMMCGDFRPDENEKVVVDGREPRGDDGWQWASLQGAVDMWMLCGGLVHQEPDDEHGGYWLERLNHNIGKIRRDHVVPMPVQKLVGGMFDPHPWRVTLMSFPDCGEQLSRDIANYCDSLAHSLWWMTTMEDVGHIKGVGENRKRAWRRWLGLEDGQILLPINSEDRDTVDWLPIPEKVMADRLEFTLADVKELEPA